MRSGTPVRGEPCGLGSAGVSKNKKKRLTSHFYQCIRNLPITCNVGFCSFVLRELRIFIVLAKTHSICLWRHRIETNQRPLVYSKEVVCSVNTQAVISRHVSDAFYFFGIIW